MILSPDQQACYDAIIAWLDKKQAPNRLAGKRIVTLGGLAGTGKTTVVSQLAVELQERGLNVAYVAFTGRAMSVLNRKMNEAGVTTTGALRRQEDDHGDRYFQDDDDSDAVAFTGTLHRLLYKPVVDEETDELLGFTKRQRLDRDYDFIVCDEASMVGDDLLHDLSSHGVPLLAVGDHGQLPPVQASGELMKHPDLRLEKIHRQAEGNPIIQLAHRIRNGGSLPRATEGSIEVRSRGEIDAVLKAAYSTLDPLDVGLVCWTNRMRLLLNGFARRALGRSGIPKKGEAVLCLQNLREHPIYNGMRGRLTEDAEQLSDEPWKLRCNIEFPQEGVSGSDLELCVPQLTRPETYKSIDDIRRDMPVRRFGEAGHLFSYGYAMTVHKSQGSGWPLVILYCDRPERSDEDTRRFYYTALTRSSDRLVLLR